ncbi:MAG: hypothetical protein Unbinned6242contig1001_23 [Prokaryotic dsDNA virus sp.]|nr:MAG: hypothetical protein Unbinned6242contig1001_23 [Prokaryotic dsDNA virus sp.]|tara:strand:+ start:1414 stop:1590 length:177 start_codon:yes stop_codon:yes gene_type:complete
MLTREHTPQNIKKNEEEVKYQTANDSIDLSGIADGPTKTAMEKLLVMVRAEKEVNRNG